MAGNQAVEINPANLGIGITDHGSDWFWTVFSIFGLNSLIHAGFYIIYNRSKNSDSKYKSLAHVAPLGISAILAYTYYTLASNLGWTGVETEFNHIEIDDNVRQIFYARYIGWFLSFPLLFYQFEFNLLSQNILTSADFFQIFNKLFLTIASTEVFVLGLLIGSLIKSTYKWGYWTFGVSAQIFTIIVFTTKQFNSNNGSKSLLSKLLIPFFIIVYILYPVNWGLSEGGNVIQPDSEGVFYGVLDLVLFWLTPYALIFDSRKNGLFVDSNNLPNTNNGNNDLEKQVETPELRASGETEVNPTEDQDAGQLETQRPANTNA
ncbi:putative membrane protein [Wickerhamomyces ciferrii]|uniref:Membrane protein n=1 Tax=Wickerhamomyces ciferrii (strain ATCC 14091 / BCRC 22168 / CBS 111 / JCM 3599 / NBRC 0793 / NRRL Y-1031 F-60-10) TaxID=1206466 RepID=K0KNN8_WICCF|nr:uncharacterized protein BN7_3316 [Wickerhamomyces ciferrii]CCH43762.1 putative membrane protein [Wickerhamomyces ciferrii]